MRTWTFSSNGKSEGGALSYRKGGRIDAAFWDFLGTNIVVLKLDADGKEYPIKISTLSAGDQDYLSKLQGKSKVGARVMAMELSEQNSPKPQSGAPATNHVAQPTAAAANNAALDEQRIRSRLSGYEELSSGPQASMNHRRAYVYGRVGQISGSSRPGAIAFTVSRAGGGRVPCIAYKDHDTEMDADATIFSHTPMADEVSALSPKQEVAFVGHVVVLKSASTPIFHAQGGVFFSVEEIMKP